MGGVEGGVVHILPVPLNQVHPMPEEKPVKLVRWRAPVGVPANGASVSFIIKEPLRKVRVGAGARLDQPGPDGDPTPPPPSSSSSPLRPFAHFIVKEALSVPERAAPPRCSRRG